MGFAGFVDADFDAYLPRKWQSHLFNRERLEVKQKLTLLGREVAEGLVGTDGVPLVAEPSVEYPALWNHKRVEAQHLYFTRGEVARKELGGLIDKGTPLAALIEDPTPYRKHALLKMFIDHQGIEIAFRLHADARVDRQNLERKVTEFFQRERLVHLLRSLPSAYRVGIIAGTLLEPQSVDDDRLQSLVQEFGASASWFSAGRPWTRDDLLVRGRDLVATAREALSLLLRVYQFIAWSRENDFLAVRETLRKAEETRRSHGVTKGDRVRIVRGVFSGKAGVVQSIDPQGGMRVLVGTMALKLSSEDVAKK